VANGCCLWFHLVVWFRTWIMVGKSPVVASAVQRRDLIALSHSRDRGEADRARALLLTLAGWTSPRIAEAFGVREDTVRLWRSAFVTGGVDALRRSVAPGPAPVKAECALAVAEEVLSRPVADRPNWTLPRLADGIEKRSGVRISRSRLSVVLRQKGISAGDGRAIP
jgi:transposase